MKGLKCSIVRELHVYGSAVPVQARDPTKFQHQVCLRAIVVLLFFRLRLLPSLNFGSLTLVASLCLFSINLFPNHHPKIGALANCSWKILSHLPSPSPLPNPYYSRIHRLTTLATTFELGLWHTAHGRGRANRSGRAQIGQDTRHIRRGYAQLLQVRAPINQLHLLKDSGHRVPHYISLSLTLSRLNTDRCTTLALSHPFIILTKLTFTHHKHRKLGYELDGPYMSKKLYPLARPFRLSNGSRVEDSEWE
jgi:hypothetical protein